MVFNREKEIKYLKCVDLNLPMGLHCNNMMVYTGRGRKPVGDRVRTFRVQGSPDLQYPGDAREGAGRSAAPLGGHRGRQRPRGCLQGKQVGRGIITKWITKLILLHEKRKYFNMKTLTVQ